MLSRGLRLLPIVLVAAVFAGLLPALNPVETSASTPPTTLEYFALGDSVASGHGLNSDLTACNRAPNRAYAYIARTALQQQFDQVNLHHLACSGATALRPSDEVLAQDPQGHKWLSHQVADVLARLTGSDGQEAIPADRPVLVSITIGANDLDFLEPVPVARMLSLPEPQFSHVVNTTTNNVATQVQLEAASLLRYPNVTIVLTEYGNPVNPGSIFFAGWTGYCVGILFLDASTCFQRSQKVIEGQVLEVL